GFGGSNDLGSMEDQQTINTLANCPTGWTPFGTPANVTITQSSWFATATIPGARAGKGILIAAATAAGSGINTTVPIPVVSGKDYVLNWQMHINAGSGHKVVIVDANATSKVVATYTPASTDVNFICMGVRTGVVFTV